jgi:hypothetical protein
MLPTPGNEICHTIILISKYYQIPLTFLRLLRNVLNVIGFPVCFCGQTGRLKPTAVSLFSLKEL